MSQSKETLESYYKILLEVYNSTLNILIQLENHNLSEALEIQKRTQALIQRSESFLHGINPQRLGLDEQDRDWVEKTTALHYKIELLTQRCQILISDYKEQLRDKLKQLQSARRMNEANKQEQSSHIAHIG